MGASLQKIGSCCLARARKRRRVCKPVGFRGISSPRQVVSWREVTCRTFGLASFVDCHAHSQAGKANVKQRGTTVQDSLKKRFAQAGESSVSALVDCRAASQTKGTTVGTVNSTVVSVVRVMFK